MTKVYPLMFCMTFWLVVQVTITYQAPSLHHRCLHYTLNLSWHAGTMTSKYRVVHKKFKDTYFWNGMPAK